MALWAAKLTSIETGKTHENSEIEKQHSLEHLKMTTVRAAQIVYTRAERDQSPRRVAGFQTLFCSQQALPTDVVEEAELYFSFDSASHDEGGLVFGPVGKRDLLLARRTPVSDVDRCGRGGNYIAHAVVFSDKDFRALGGNPIAIARDIPFITELADALSCGDSRSGSISPLEVSSVRPGNVLDALTEEWSTDNLSNLLVLASCAERLSGRDAPVAIVGAATDVANVLELVFAVMPHALRCRLSFDSVGASSKQSAPFWACGFTNEPRHLSYLIDARQKTADTVDGDLILTSFGNWLRVHVRESRTTNLARSGEAAWGLCRLIDQEVSAKPTPIGNADAYLAARVWKANRERAEFRLLQTLQDSAGPLLAERVFESFLANYEAAALFQSMIRPDEEQITRGLHAEYCRLRTPPAEDEQRAVEQLIRRRPDIRLALWLCAWRRDWSRLKEKLERLGNDAYQISVKSLLILEELDPLYLYLTGRGRLLTEAIAEAWPHSRIDLDPIVERLLREEEIDGLLPLVPLLAGQSRASLSYIQRRLRRKHIAAAPAFVAALGQALEQKKSQRSWLRQMFARGTARSRES